MTNPDYVNVRRPANATFRVLPEDLASEAPPGYDLSLMRNLADDGLLTPISVRPLGGGRFEVVDGRKRLAAIRLLVRLNRLVFDELRGFARPARQVFALLRCRIPTRRDTRPGVDASPRR